MAKNSLKRYNHYYERWATNESSRVKALSDLQQMQAVQIEKLRDTLGQPRVSGLMFVIEAWLQIVECRRVLKWTYAYGYYLHAGILQSYHMFWLSMQHFAETNTVLFFYVPSWRT